MPAENWKILVMYEYKGWERNDSLGALIVLRNVISRTEQRVRQGHSFGTHSALKHGITAVTNINFSMGSVAIMTYSWRTLSYWPDRQYWFIEETSMLSWQPEVMVGGNRAGDGKGCSLSFELYCRYRFPIRKKDGPRYWPTTSMKVRLNHSGRQRPSSPQHHSDVIQCSDLALCVSVCVPGCCWYKHAWWSVAWLSFVHPLYSICICVLRPDRIVCEMSAAPKGSAAGPVKLCVSECRPELRAQSSQFYSFVVILTLKRIYFAHLFVKQALSVRNELGWRRDLLMPEQSLIAWVFFKSAT